MKIELRVVGHNGFSIDEAWLKVQSQSDVFQVFFNGDILVMSYGLAILGKFAGGFSGFIGKDL